MSDVTNVIICCSLMEEVFTECAFESINHINEWLQTHPRGCSGGRLVRVDKHAGGTKAMECCVFAGAFNYMPLQDFLRTVWKQNWQSRDTVQVLVQEQEDDKFTLHSEPSHPSINSAGFCTQCGDWLVSALVRKGLFDLNEQQSYLKNHFTQTNQCKNIGGSNG